MTNTQHTDTDTVHRIVEWFRTAKPEPTIKNVLTQLGCHLEEVEEMIGALNNVDSDLAHELRQASNELKSIDVEQYAAEVHTMMSEWDKVELLDSLCDQIVTAIGTAYDLGFDIEGALKEVAASNESKFEEGKPVFDENMKIIKGKNYFKPDLTKYTGTSHE